MSDIVEVQVHVNATSVRRPVAARTTLADFLREHCGLTGTHLGCEHGVCGACTVLLDGVVVRSCLVLAVQADGNAVSTIEGLAGADGQLHPVQQAMHDCHAFQCGFCAPGFIMATVALLAEQADPSNEQIIDAMSGNLCRCTGYASILDGVRAAAARQRTGEPEGTTWDVGSRSTTTAIQQGARVKCDVHDQLFVDGRWIRSSTNSTMPVLNPATEQTIAEITEGSAEDADRAVTAARKAFESWSRTPPEERGMVVARMGQALRRRGDRLAETISRELGVPRHLAFGSQIRGPAEKFGSYAELATSYPWKERIGDTSVLRAPAGVVVAVTPWNFPLIQATNKVAAAMIAGCTVVLKPSELTPLTTLALAEIAQEAEVPAGVFNLVNGAGTTVGDALVRHPEVDMISFTGSTEVGKSVAERAAQRIARTVLELGGKSATILLDDADLETAVAGAIRGCFYNSGQVCTALSRLLVPHSCYEEVLDRAKIAAAAYTVGDPTTEVDLGPLVSAHQRDRVRRYIELGIEEGARLIVGGRDAPDGLATGYYVQPTVFADVDNSMSIARDEIFGPVLSILSYKDEDEAVRIANDSQYGLSGSVWSQDLQRAEWVAGQLRTGMVRLNGATDQDAPMGGFKQSGIGREHGRFGVDQFVEIQAITGGWA